MVKPNQTICRRKADELFECVWPFCGIVAWRVKDRKDWGKCVKANLFSIIFLFYYGPLFSKSLYMFEKILKHLKRKHIFKVKKFLKLNQTSNKEASKSPVISKRRMFRATLTRFNSHPSKFMNIKKAPIQVTLPYILSN